MLNKLKNTSIKLSAVVAMVVGTTTALAAIDAPIGGSLGVLAPAASVGYSGHVSGADVSFSDQVTFSVASLAGSVNSTTSSSIFGQGFQTFSTSLWDGGTKLVDGLSTFNAVANGIGFWTSVFAYAPLQPASAFSIHIEGKTLAASTMASYGGSLTVTPIPEPDTYAALLAGLALMGFVMRRRKGASLAA